MQRQSWIGKIWGMFSPFLLYYVLFAVLQEVLYWLVPAFHREENAMWLLTAVNVGLLPIFGWMYYGDGFRAAWHSREAWNSREAGRHSRPTRFGPAEALAVILGAACLSRGVNLLIGLTPLPWLFPGYEEVSELIYAGSLVSQIAASVFSAALLEELLMRGLLYNRMKAGLRNVKLAMLVNALVFGLFHGNVVQGVYAAILGLFFVQIYERYQSLWPAVLAHMAANATSVLMEEYTWFNEIAENLVVYYLQTVLFLLVGWACWKYCSGVSKLEQ